MKRPLQQLLKRVYLLLDFFVEKPSRGLALLMGLQVLGWGVMATFFNAVPHHDILFNSLVGLYGEEAYEPRHPPLVYIVHHWLNMGEGLLPLPHYVAAQFFVIATYGVVYRLGVVLLKNKEQSLAATLLLVGLHVYQGYTWVGVNQDVMMLSVLGVDSIAHFLCHAPFESRCTAAPLVVIVGVCYGNGPIWMKYSHRLYCWQRWGYGFVMDKEARAHLATPYPYGALLICLCVAAIPLEQAWQYSHDIMGYGKFSYDSRKFLVESHHHAEIHAACRVARWVGLIEDASHLSLSQYDKTRDKFPLLLCIDAIHRFFVAGVAMDAILKILLDIRHVSSVESLIGGTGANGLAHIQYSCDFSIGCGSLIKALLSLPIQEGFLSSLE